MLRRTRRIGFAAVCMLAAAPTGTSAQLMDNAIYSLVRVSEAEYVSHSHVGPFAYDADGWIGGDYTRVWFKLAGEHGRKGDGQAEVQLLYSELIRPFWELQLGARLDALYGDGTATRPLLAVGLLGLAPYWFELEAFVFLSDDGDVSSRFDAAYDLPITQRLILEPEITIDLAVQDVPEFGVSSGLSGIETGVRLRFEIIREFAPYVGWAYEARFGESADFAQDLGQPARYSSFVVGVRVWR